ncbi:hypothetical protein [Mycobacterium sp. 852013-50091_SCH5140682]|uniref:hypothetical protein n=1 Tax=Mycobacterium sp. 852013-50091_SCH5140682 TaxID=1834109 RepID=UPI000A73FDEA|nr:hypothetical protein [Mycobacterium sp. 852013-50091_SCH5140682]
MGGTGIGSARFTVKRIAQRVALFIAMSAIPAMVVGCAAESRQPAALDDVETTLPVPANIPPFPFPSDLPPVPLPSAVPNVQMPADVPTVEMPADVPHIEMPADIPDVPLPSAIPPITFP